MLPFRSAIGVHGTVHALMAVAKVPQSSAVPPVRPGRALQRLKAPPTGPDACLRMAGSTGACCCRGPWGCQAS